MEIGELMDKFQNDKNRRSSTRRIAELPGGSLCTHPEHNPPSHMVYSDGIWEHVCPACGKVQQFIVTNPIL